MRAHLERGCVPRVPRRDRGAQARSRTATGAGVRGRSFTVGLAVLDRVLVSIVGIAMIVIAWLMATRESWTSPGARALLRERPASRLRRLNLRADIWLTRVVAPLLVAGLGIAALLVSVFGLLE